MAMSDEEREKLKKLSPDDLVEMFAAMREERDKLGAKYREERKKFIEDALKKGDDGRGDDGDENNVNNLTNNAAFQRLKKKIF